MPSRYCIQYVSKSARPSSGHRTGKCQFSSQFPRRVLLINVLAIGQLHSFPMIGRSCLKSCMLGFNVMQTKNFQVSKAGLRKGRGTTDQIANIHWITEKARDFQKNIYLCFFNYTKAFYCVDNNKLWKSPKEMEIPDHLTCLLRNLYIGQEATVRTLYGTAAWFKTEKGL